ncbi:MAG TPA: hypothetical protein VFS21_26770 [Roseiflexaceae bacterium]|nr:hypothetical protein [Roseiflexaceae bacterium]
MPPSSPNDLFRPFLETRVPLLFLIGSLALAVLGNATYELLTTTFGATPEFLIGLIASAILIFTFVALSFRRLLRALDARRVVVRNTVAPDQQAEPHAGLILPVGLNQSGPEQAIVAWHQRNVKLRHCWVLASPEVERSTKFGDLKQRLLEGNTTVHVVSLGDSIQADQVYSEVCAAIAAARRFPDASPLIADITGGTKAMTAGTLLACLAADVTVQYWTVPRDEQGNPRLVTEGCAMKVVVRRVAQEGNGDDAAA